MKRGGHMGSEGGRSSLIDSVKRSAVDVNDWTLPFPRSRASGNGHGPIQNMTDSAGGLGGAGGDMGHEKMSSAPDSSASLRKWRAFPASADAGPKAGTVA